MSREAPDHDRFEDAVASYLLGSMPSEEHEEFEAHLHQCAACSQEYQQLTVAVDALPASAAPLIPPPELKARIMAVVERDASLLAAAGPEADRPPEPARRSRRLRLPGLPRLSLGAPAAVAAVLLLGVLGGVAVDRLLSNGGRTVVASVNRGMAPNASADLEIDDGEATLVARGLPQPPSGRVYQVWLKRPGHAPDPTSALFTPSRDGTATTSVPGSLDGVERVMVTAEPDGGSKVPSTRPMLSASTS